MCSVGTSVAGPALEAAACVGSGRSVLGKSRPAQSQSRVSGRGHTERAVHTQDAETYLQCD